MRSSAATVLLAAALLSCGARRNNEWGASVTGGNPNAGPTAIARYGCGSCHNIPGVYGAAGRVGPPLGNVGKRTYIAGELPNRPENLIRWIQHPHSVNERTVMPEMGVTDQDAKNIAAFLYSVE